MGREKREWFIQRCISAARNDYQGWPSYAQRFMTRNEMKAAPAECAQMWASSSEATTSSTRKLATESRFVPSVESSLDPSRKSGGALHRLHCFCLEFDGACEVQRRVPTDWIIEPIDVSGYGSFSLAS